MNCKVVLPKSFDELKLLDDEQLEQLWNKYFTVPKRQVRKSMYRPLWYKVSCDVDGLKIEQKHITKLNKYATDPERYIEKACKTKYNLKKGVEIIKTYKSLTYRVMVINNNEFLYEGKIYKTISSVAKEICGKKVSGYDFFGLDNKKPNKNILRGSDE